MDLELAGRVAIVTGGSSGIGLAITRGLLAEGVRVVVADRQPSPDAHPDLHDCVGDLDDTTHCERVVEEGLS